MAVWRSIQATALAPSESLHRPVGETELRWVIPEPANCGSRAAHGGRHMGMPRGVGGQFVRDRGRAFVDGTASSMSAPSKYTVIMTATSTTAPRQTGWSK